MTSGYPHSTHRFQPTYSPYQQPPSYINEGYSHLPNMPQIPGQSHIEYIPYQRKVIQWEEVEEVEYVPYERKYIEYEDRKRIQKVPVQKNFVDYYTIEHITEYIPRVVPETHIEYVPVEKVENRLEYYPVERQFIIEQGVNQSIHSKTQTYPAGYESQFSLNQKTKQNVPPASYTSYHQYPSYPVYHPDLHKVVQGSAPAHSKYQYKGMERSSK